MLNLYNLQNKDKVEAKPEDPTNGNIDPINGQSKKADFGSYVDPRGELDTKKLKWGMWFARHRIMLYRLVVIAIFLVAFSLWSFSLYKWYQLLWHYPVQKQMYAQLTNMPNYTDINNKLAAQPLQVAAVQEYASGVNKKDVIADIYNPNKSHVIYFDYYFDGLATSSKYSTFIYPEQNRPVAVLGLTSTGGSSPSMQIENVRYQRINPHKVADVKTWVAEYYNFKVENFKFTQSYSVSDTQADAHSVKFKLTNNSPYDYNSAQFLVGLFQSGSFAGVIPFSIDKFKSLQSEEVDLRSFVNGLVIDEVKIYPILDILDESSFTKANST